MCINTEARVQPPNQLAMQNLTKKVPERFISQEKLTHFPWSFEEGWGRGHSKDCGNARLNLASSSIKGYSLTFLSGKRYSIYTNLNTKHHTHKVQKQPLHFKAPPTLHRITGPVEGLTELNFKILTETPEVSGRLQDIRRNLCCTTLRGPLIRSTTGCYSIGRSDMAQPMLVRAFLSMFWCSAC